MKQNLALGSLAPDFTLLDSVRDDQVCLSAFRGRDVLLIFFRGTWCPFCREQMRLLTENCDRLSRAGVTIIGVVCQSASSVRQYLKNHPLPFPLLIDANREAAKQYGTHYWFSFEGFNLANPALFILDANGCITFSYIGRNMRDLPVARVLEKFVAFIGDEKSMVPEPFSNTP